MSDATRPLAEPRVFETVRVEASGSYDVVVGRGLLPQAGERVRAAVPGTDDAVLLVTDSNLGPLYLPVVQASLEKAGFRVSCATIPAGEESKRLANYAVLQEVAAQAGLTRASTVVALGGGVVGDLAGFVAATYMRGCHLVQLSTSLLAMVDSSVGGKTAVDLPEGKNLTGAFYQPDLVLCDLDCLATLPPLFASDGTGEVVKYAVMADPELFGWLQAPVAGQEERVVARCVAIKRDVVQADEREGGLRKLLNLGHTVGHAIELLGDYRIPHGHAVAAGMAVMVRACAAKGWCAPEDAAAVEAMLRVHGLPTGTSRTPAELCAAALRDKKRTGDRIDAVVVRAIGRCEVRSLSLAEFAELVELGCAAVDVVYAEGEKPAASPALSLVLDGTQPATAVVEPGHLAGSVAAISSKSAAHRLLICAALADAPTRVVCGTTSQDIEATCDCLRALGASVERDGDIVSVTPIPHGSGATQGRAPWLNCGESGSTLRFMLPVACALGGPHLFLGAGRLPERPLEPLRTRLMEHGCTIAPAGMWPLAAWGQLEGGVFDLPGNVSSQYVTGLLLALPLLPEGGCVRLHGVVESRPYIDMTLAALRTFGVEVDEREDLVGSEADGGESRERCAVFSVPAGSAYRSPGTVAVEGDWSNAAFWLCAGALSPVPVTVTGLDLGTDQGDLAVLDVLGDFGTSVRVHPGEGWATVCGRDLETGELCTLRGTVIDARQVPDLIPVLSMVAACAKGETRVENAGRLRIKESDRLQTTAGLLRAFGVPVEELPDGLVIQGGGSGSFDPCLAGCSVSSCGDHRIAMAAAVAAGRASGPVRIEGAQAVAKSYPGFFGDLSLLGGAVRVERPAAEAGAVGPLRAAGSCEAAPGAVASLSLNGCVTWSLAPQVEGGC